MSGVNSEPPQLFPGSMDGVGAGKGDNLGKEQQQDEGEKNEENNNNQVRLVVLASEIISHEVECCWVHWSSHLADCCTIPSLPALIF